MNDRFNLVRQHARALINQTLKVYPPSDHRGGMARAAGFVLGAFVALSMSVGSQTAWSHPSQIPVDEPDAVAPEAATSGCNRAAIHTGVFNMTTIDGNKRTRTYMIQVPADYSKTKQYSLNFVFHAAGGNSSQSYSWGLQNASGASESGIFVYPNGIPYQNYGVGWDDTVKGYDLPFFDNMLKSIEAEFCINTSRVFAAGFSWGGDFVTSLVCNRSTVIRAAAINSATDEFRDKNNYWTYQGIPCAGLNHSAIRFEHAVGGDSEYPAPYFMNTSRLYRYLDSCTTESKPAPSSTSAMTCVSYQGCKVEYIECNFNASIGHALPPNWAKDTWAFFSTFG